jgi:hypothetical protein
VLAGQVGGDAHPGRAEVIVPADAVPVELHAHPAVFVGVDLVARRADDEGGLQAVDAGCVAAVAWRRAPRDALAQAGEAGTVLGGLILPGFVVVVDEVMGIDDEEFVVTRSAADGLDVVGAGQGEAAAGLDGVGVAFGREVLGAGLVGLHAPSGERIPVGGVPEAVSAGIVVDFQRRQLALVVEGWHVGRPGWGVLKSKLAAL